MALCSALIVSNSLHIITLFTLFQLYVFPLLFVLFCHCYLHPIALR